MTTARTRVLAMLHLPPPVHGAAMVGAQFVDRVGRRVPLTVIPLRFARSIGELGRPGVRKAAIALSCGIRQLARLVTRRADVAYITPAGQGGALVRDAAYMLLFRFFRLPFIAHVHTMGVPAAVRALPGSLRGPVEAAYRGAQAVLALNETHREELETLVTPGSVVVLPNGLPDIHPAERPRPDRILFLSNLLEAKGPFTLLEALPAIRKVAPDARPTFAGGWPDAALERRFLARARELEVDDWIELSGRVGPERKLELLSETHVFVFPSTYPSECQPMVLIEAMRHGLPMVVTRHAAIPDVAGDAAIVVPPRDPAGLAEAVARVLDDELLARRLAAAARQRYLERHRIEDWEQRMVEILGSAAKPGREVPFTGGGG